MVLTASFSFILPQNTQNKNKPTNTPAKQQYTRNMTPYARMLLLFEHTCGFIDVIYLPKLEITSTWHTIDANYLECKY